MSTHPRRKHGGHFNTGQDAEYYDAQATGNGSNNIYEQPVVQSYAAPKTKRKPIRHGGAMMHDQRQPDPTQPRNDGWTKHGGAHGQEPDYISKEMPSPPLKESPPLINQFNYDESHIVKHSSPGRPPVVQVQSVSSTDSQDRFHPHVKRADTVPVSERRKMHQIGYRNLFVPRTTFRWKTFRTHQKAPLMYRSQQRHRHRDAAGRVYEGIEEDRFILPSDIHLARMMVQCTDDVYAGIPNSTWRRTFVRNRSPLTIRVANWPFNSIPPERTAWDNGDWTVICLKWPLACLSLSYAFTTPSSMFYSWPTGGYYPPLNYKFWGYPKVARNSLENANGQGSGHSAAYDTNPVSERPLHPRKLWICQEKHTEFELHDVDQWMSQNDSAEHSMQFVFVAYTTNQFNSPADLNVLHATARQAARDAGVTAYWTSADCMSNNDTELELDVYRISDVIRAAHSIAIALKQPNSTTYALTEKELLRDWGSRAWTLPEALLGPSNSPIRIYNDTNLALSVYKRNLPSLVSADSPTIRQLIDHYEGNLTLSRLELVILALKALSARHTSTYLPGDLAYILMGLLRRRPHVDGTDSEFQAFARLSLANDSDRLLERLICVQPRHPDQAWYVTSDAFAANLWDIEPRCQIANVCANDTVVLDGCFAASIRWESFLLPYHENTPSWKRLAANMMLRLMTLAVPWLIILMIYNPIMGGILLGFCLPVWLLSPWLVKICYGGKAWNIAPYLFGFEGYLDIDTIESNIYGFPGKKLHWSAAGSALSRHRMNEYQECIGHDPTHDPAVDEKVQRAKNAQFGDMRIFTLVDTRSGLVTLFEAARPPVAALFCGQEGGMQRAVMVSLDWKTSTLYRETVLRMPTVMLERLWRVDRVRVGLKRPLEETAMTAGNEQVV